jgi:hypothetical protein
MKPGRHIYSCALPGSEEEDQSKFFVHKCIVQKREEECPVSHKDTKEMSKYRQFVKHKSVFEDWIENTPEDY